MPAQLSQHVSTHPQFLWIDIIIPNSISIWMNINIHKQKHSWSCQIGTIEIHWIQDAPAQRLVEFPHCVHRQCHSWRSCGSMRLLNGNHGEPHLCWADPGMNKPYTVYIYIIYVSNMYKHSEYMIHLTSLAWNLGTANHVARHLTLNGWIGGLTNSPHPFLAEETRLPILGVRSDCHMPKTSQDQNAEAKLFW